MNKKLLYLLTFLIPFYVACGGQESYYIKLRGVDYRFIGIERSENNGDKKIRAVFGNLDGEDDLFLDDISSDGLLTSRGKSKDKDGLDCVSTGSRGYPETILKISDTNGSKSELTQDEEKYLNRCFIRVSKK